MNSGRARRVIWWGVAASVLLHLGLLSGSWIIPPILLHVDEPPPLTARLVSTPPPPSQPVKRIAKSTPPKSGKLALPRRPPALASESPEVPAEVPTEVPTEVSPAESNTAPAGASDPVPNVIEQPVALETPSGPPLNPLPNRVRLEYRARISMATGQMSLLWVNEGGRYTVTSILSPKGITSLAYSGQLVQISRGRIVASGLQPEEFWDQRGDKRSQSRFDYVTGTVLIEGSKGTMTLPLQEGMQDIQSLLFQLALTAPPPAESDSAMFNGKKIRNYRYRLVGEENLDTPLGTLRTLHIMRVIENGEEPFEVWLATDHYFLPVKLSTEISGYSAKLLVQSISEN